MTTPATYAWRSSDRGLGWTLALSPLAIAAAYFLALIAMGVVSALTPKSENPQSSWDEMAGIFEGMMAGFAVASVTLCVIQIVVTVIIAVIAFRQLSAPHGRTLAMVTICVSAAAGLAILTEGAVSLNPELVVSSEGELLNDALRWTAPTLTALAASALLLLLRRCGVIVDRLAVLPLVALAGLLFLIPSVPVLDLLAAFFPAALVGTVWLRALRNDEAGGPSVDAPPAPVNS